MKRKARGVSIYLQKESRSAQRNISHPQDISCETYRIGEADISFGYDIPCGTIYSAKAECDQFILTALKSSSAKMKSVPSIIVARA